MPRNNDPFAPWNDPMYKNDPLSPHNDPMYRDDPFKPWNDHFGSEDDLTDRERQAYGLRPRRRHDNNEEEY